MTVLLLLFVVAILSASLLGFGAGVGGTRAVVGQILLCVLIVVAIMIIDRPRRGFITVDHQSIHDLKNTLRGTP